MWWDKTNKNSKFHEKVIWFGIFFREFQPIVSAPDDSSLSLDQDTNQFFV